MKVLIVDDEGVARRRLRQVLEQEPAVAAVQEAADGLQALACIEAGRPDVLFLDVELPELDGFALLRRLPAQRRPALILATAHDTFALPAFEADAVDYLLKPFDDQRIRQALHKARRWLGAAPAVPAPERLLLQVGDVQQLVRQQDIRYLTAARNYVQLHTLSGALTVRDSLTAIGQRLDPGRFRRVHRSHIVNLDHVDKILPWFGGDSLLMMSDGCRLNLSRNFRGVLDAPSA
jgi:two-component system, LytTR family, response regulator